MIKNKRSGRFIILVKRMQDKTLIVCAIIFYFITILFLNGVVVKKVIGRSKMKSSEEQYQEIIEDLVEKLNKERVENGLNQLQIDWRLQQVADYKLKNMIEEEYFAHISPTGQTAWDILDKFGYNYSFAGENLAMNFKDAAGLHRAWMRSPEHRKNILFPNYTKIGLAIGSTKDGSSLAVEYFATPFIVNEGKENKDKGTFVQLVGGSKTELGVGIFRKISVDILNSLQESRNDKLITANNIILLFLELVALVLVVGIWTLEKEDEMLLKRIERVSCVS